MKKNLKYIFMFAAIPTSLVLAGNDKAHASDFEAAESTETSAVVSNEVEVPVSEGVAEKPENDVLPATVENSVVPTAKEQNIVNEGGHVNVEGKNATLSSDGKGVTYSYTVAFQRMHSSDHLQTVSDLAIRVPNISNAKVDLTLVGTRDKNGNPVTVNAPMKEVNCDEAKSNDDAHAYDIPTAEELAAGKQAHFVTGNDYLTDIGAVKTFNVYTNFNKSQAIKVSVTVPLEEAKKIKYLPIDARMIWRASQEGGIQGYESGAHSLEEYPNHSIYAEGSTESPEEFRRLFKGLADPTLIDESYVENGHLIKSVSNPSTYITPNNGDWTTIPEDVNIDKKTFFNYVETFNLKYNPVVTFYVSEKEDMADQDVSALYQGDVVVDYVIKGTDKQIKGTYTDTAATPIYDSNGNLVTYNTAENSNERPQNIIVDGKKYVLVGTSSGSAAETGVLKEGTIHVVYEYELESTPTPSPEPTPTPEPSPEPTPIPEPSPMPNPGSTPMSEPDSAITISEQSTENVVIETQKVANKKQLPNTGTESSTTTSSLMGILAAVMGLFLRQKKENNK